MLSPKTRKQNETNAPVIPLSDITPKEPFQESLQLYFVQKKKKIKNRNKLLKCFQ